MSKSEGRITWISTKQSTNEMDPILRLSTSKRLLFTMLEDICLRRLVTYGWILFASMVVLQPHYSYFACLHYIQVVHFVMNLHTLPRVFYLTRHGQSDYNLLGKIGGDSGLTDAGRKFARRLADFAHNHVGMKVEKDEETGEEKRTPQPARLWTSTLRRTKETAQYIKHTKIPAFKWDNGDVVEWIQFQGRARRNLDELYAGVCDGLTYKEIEEKYPEEFARRQEDKLTYRYPRGKTRGCVEIRFCRL